MGNFSKSQNRSRAITPERAVLLDCVLRGEKHQDVADDFGVDRSTVTRTFRKWRTQESLESLPRVGRLKLIQPREERALLRIVRRNPKSTVQAAPEGYSSWLSCITYTYPL